MYMRFVSANQTRFSESISALRAGVPKDTPAQAPLMLSFEMQRSITTAEFELKPTMRIELLGELAGFVSMVSFESSAPDGEMQLRQQGHVHRCSQAIAALFSFVSESKATAPRDDYLANQLELSPDDYTSLAIEAPTLYAGPGSTSPFISPDRLQIFEDRVCELVDLLRNIEDDDLYRSVMESIRLAQMAHHVKLDDFELGFSLLVASIEAASNLAIDRTDPELQDTKISYSSVELKVKHFCEAEGGEVGGWFKQNVRDRAKVQRKYVEYIKRYCPSETWTREVLHPLQHVADLRNQLNLSGSADANWFLEQDGPYPEDLTPAQLESILIDTYEHRSSYVHTGKSVPHTGTALMNRFFEVWTDYERSSGLTEEILLAKFELMSAIARASLINWLKSRV